MTHVSKLVEQRDNFSVPEKGWPAAFWLWVVAYQRHCWRLVATVLLLEGWTDRKYATVSVYGVMVGHARKSRRVYLDA